MKTSHAQQRIVEAVALRGYLTGWTDDEMAARQLVKEFEELCEALAAVTSHEPALVELIDRAVALGRRARAVFDLPHLFKGVTVNTAILAQELPDLFVPLAVLSDALAVDDGMAAAVRKAEADVQRGVRNGEPTTSAGR